MTSSVFMIVLILACFLAAVVNLASDSRFRRGFMRFAILTAVCSGAFFYGYGYAHTLGISVVSVIRALMALCRMFGGVNDLASIQTAPIFQYPAALALFWFAHFLAFYVTASAAIATLGERLLRRIRVTLLRKGPLLLIYGLNPRSVAYGRRMAGRHERSVLFVDADSNPALESAVKSFGGVVEKSADALSASPHFLRQVNMKAGSRQLELAALHADGRKNLAYARALLDSLNALGISAGQTRLLAAGIGEEAASLQALSSQGYGSVFAFDDYDLTARMIIQGHPPCSLLSFSPVGTAEEDFHAVLLGFGRMGRSILTQLVMNGQFEGSRFQVDIFDPAPQSGFLHDHPLTKHYDIRFHQADGTTDGFYAFLAESRKSVRMIAICTGSPVKNHEIAEDLANWYPRYEAMPLVIHATRECYFWLDENRQEKQSASLFDGPGLDVERLDAAAMQINHIYQQESGSTGTAWEEWQVCTYEDRQSSRAAADFYPAVMRAASRTAEQVLAGQWPPAPDVLENLAKTEHLRWCAYQYVLGYAPMPPEVWQERAARYAREKAQGLSPRFAIGKDRERRLHACLIPWEDLNALSRQENAVTGRQVDYQQMDRNNVLMVSRVLAIHTDQEEEPHG